MPHLRNYRAVPGRLMARVWPEPEHISRDFAEVWPDAVIGLAPPTT